MGDRLVGSISLFIKGMGGRPDHNNNIITVLCTPFHFVLGNYKVSIRSRIDFSLLYRLEIDGIYKINDSPIFDRIIGG